LILHFCVKVIDLLTYMLLAFYLSQYLFDIVPLFNISESLLIASLDQFTFINRFARTFDHLSELLD